MHQIEPEFQLGKSITIRSGHDATLICTGVMLELSVKFSEYLKEQDFSLQVTSMPTVFPCDREAIARAAQSTKKIITIEEHGIGGLGTIVAEVLAEMDEAVKFIPMRLPRQPVSTAGSQNYWREKNQLSVDSLTKLIAAH